MKHLLSALVVLGCMVLNPNEISAQSTSAFSLFASDSLIHVRLITDMEQLVKDKREEEYQPGVLQIFRSPGDTMQIDVDVRSRGNVRKEMCYYPPIRVKLPSEKYAFHKLKWVIPCRDSESYHQFVLKEYIAYRMFEILTDRAFQTHLLRVEFVDTGQDDKTFSGYAFVLENEDALADRFGGRVYEPTILKEELLNMDQLALTTIFQYMIANSDWALVNRHNVEIITDPSTNSLLAIPYDFDYSGLVNTPYAVPRDELPIDRVTERYNAGVCLTEEAAENVRMLILERREELEETYNNLPYLTEQTKSEIQYMLKPFFKEMENARVVYKIFVQKCLSID